MKKDIIIAIVAVVILLVVGYLYLTKWRVSAPTAQEQALQNVNDATDSVIKSATQGVLPSFGAQENPLQSQPDINPTTKANPFSNVKTNPFE